MTQLWTKLWGRFLDPNAWVLSAVCKPLSAMHLLLYEDCGSWVNLIQRSEDRIEVYLRRRNLRGRQRLVPGIFGTVLAR